jgi:hypothetical protein
VRLPHWGGTDIAGDKPAPVGRFVGVWYEREGGDQQACHRYIGLKPILAPRVKQGLLKVVGAVYDLRTGSVSLLD